MARLARLNSRRRNVRVQQALVEALEPRQLLSTTYYVATTGNDNNAGTSAAPFATIQNAVQYLTPGDTLDVRAGTYVGFVIGWDAPDNGQYSEIDGTASAPITIQADPAAAPGSVIIDDRNNKTGDAIDLEIDENGCNYITIKGFTVNNSSGLITRDGIHVTNATGVNVIDNTVTKITRFGIYSSFTTNMLVQGNTVTDTTQGDGSTSEGHGIYISNSAVGPQIIGNIIHDNATQGIHVNGDISQGGTGIITGGIIADNQIYNNGANGINGDGWVGGTITNNLIYNNAKNGISLYQIDAGTPSTGNLIVNNTIYQPNSSGTAIELEDGSKNNIIYNNVLMGGNDGVYNVDTPSMVGMVSDYNIIVNQFDTVDSDGDTDGTYTLSQWQSQFKLDTHSFVGTSALFTNAAGDIFTLATGSAAIDAGTNISGHAAPTTDILGNPRPNGSNWDIGAYEAQTGPDTTPPTFSVITGTPTSPSAATITWTTNENSDSQVLFGTSSSYGTTTTLNTTLVTSHSVSLSNLSPSTTYHFEVRSRDSSGNLGTSSDFTFTTPAPDTTKPTASLVANNVTSSGATTYTFTVTYSDNAGVSVATLDSNDILVTGPNSFSQLATFVSVDTNADGTPRTATYSITPPGGSWDSTDVGTYTLAMQASQVSDTSGNFVNAGTLGTFSVSVPDTTKPTASLSALNMTTGGATTYTFTVTYSDNVAINVATIDSSDVKVTGPNSFSQTATLVSVDVNSNGTPRTATYKITPAGGTWDSADNGTYTVAMKSSQVADTSGNFVASGNIGTFSVNVSATDTTAPTASLSAANVTSSGGTTYNFTVTFSDNVAIDVTTLGTNDVTVTGPNSFSQVATFVSVDTNTNGTPRTATYQITAPGGTWNSADNGTYTVTMAANQVADTSGNFVAAGSLGTFAANIAAPDTTAPTASLNAGNVTTGGGSTYTFTVTYSDNVAINVSTLGTNDVTVAGPNGFSQTATFVSVNNNTNGTPRTATYTITTPGGSWDFADNGTYTVSLAGSQVADTSGNFATAGSLGSFTVSVPAPDTTAPTASLTAGNISSAGGTTYTFTVTYSDNVAVNVSTLGTNDVTVTGPNSFSQKATFVSVNTNTNGTPRIATYRITTPGGAWDFADNGNYTVTMAASQVADTSGNFVVAGSLGTFAVDIAAPDTTPPTASLNASNETNPLAVTYTFSVTYSDDVAVNVNSLGNNDVTVTGPGGFSQAATFVSVDTNSNGTPRIATYSIAAPGGVWALSANGTYTVSVNASAVTDTSGNAVAAGSIGTFAVAVPDVAPPTAQVNASTISAPGDTAYTFTVTYQDNVAIDASSLGSNNLVVTGPNGFSETATLVSIDGATDQPQHTGTYQISAPDAGWSSSANGVYTISMLAGQVEDTSGNFMAAGAIGTFLVNDPDNTPPQASLTTALDVNGTGTGYTFTVTYTDDEEVSVASLGNNDIQVTGPGGFSQAATLVSVDNNTDGTPRVATYKITPPGGSWNITDNGTYTISMKANAVTDIVLNPVAAGTLGTFNVDAPDLTRLATHLVFKQGFVTTTAGQTLNTVTVAVEDMMGRVVSGNTDNITVAINNNTGGASLLGTLTIPADTGVATFSDLSLQKSGTYQLVATDAGLTAGKSNLFGIKADASTSHLVLLQQPANTPVGKVLAPTLEYAVEDQFNNLVLTSSRVTLVALSGPGTMKGAATVATVGGIAHFAGTWFTAVGDYSLQATDASLADVTPVTYTQTITTATTVIKTPVPAAAYIFGKTIILSTMLTSNTSLATIKFSGSATITDAHNNVLGTATVGALGAVRFSITNLAAGTYVCTVNYAGDANHSSAVSPQTFTLVVNPAPSAALLAASTASDQSFTLTATVTSPSGAPNARTGTVTFMDGATVLGSADVGLDSKATFTVNNPTPGAHSYTAVYSGDSNFATSTSTAHKITVVVTAGADPVLKLITG